MRKKRESNHVAVKSYIIQRRLLGIFGMALPLMLYIGSQFDSQTLPGTLTPLRGSISAYFFSNARDIFVGVLISYAVFLITYRGYDKRDDRICNIAGSLALGIALFPAVGEGCGQSDYLFRIFSGTFNMIVHYCSAIAFFFTLAYISAKLFTLSHGYKTANKIKRNRIYRGCARIIVISIVLIILIKALEILFGLTGFSGLSVYLVFMERVKPVFLLETAALLAFGFSWLIKGQTLYRDRGPYKAEYKEALCRCKKLLGRRFTIE